MSVLFSKVLVKLSDMFQMYILTKMCGFSKRNKKIKFIQLGDNIVENKMQHNTVIQ